jgi:hypothetical protein
MCSLDVRFTVACAFDVIFELSKLKMTLKTHLTVKFWSITLAFWMCSLNVRFTVAGVFDVIFEF